jgi:hypothetical protein
LDPSHDEEISEVLSGLTNKELVKCKGTTGRTKKLELWCLRDPSLATDDADLNNYELTDDVIDNWFTLLGGKYQTEKFSKVVSTKNIDSWKSPSSRGPNKYFVPVHVPRGNRSHFLCIVFDDVANKLYIMDSLPNDGKKHTSEDTSEEKAFIEQVCQTVGRAYKEWIYLDCNHQQEHVDCGVMVCLNAYLLSLAYSKKEDVTDSSILNYDTSDSYRLRKWLAYQIYHQTVPDSPDLLL